MDDSFSSELNAWLDQAARTDAASVLEERYEVRQTLKETPAETTQVVYRRTGGGVPIGPFVRKILRGTDDGRGAAYGHLMMAQVQGIRLAHQPLLYDIEVRDSSLEVIMECVRGRDLDALVASEGAGVALTQRIVRPLCEAVIELHEMLDAPIIHRDIKPSNVMVSDDGRLVLIDLGIARAWREGAPRDTVRYGTPGYAPPEQYGYGQTDVRSDVYALGMTIAFCILGEDPGTARDAGFADERVPARMQPVLVQATHFDPAMRQSSVRALLNDIIIAFEGPAAHDLSQRKQDLQPMRFVWLGRIWNVLLTCAYALFIVVCIFAIASPGSETIIDQYPTWFRVLLYTTMGIVPFGCVAYLLFDKRRLRQHFSFAKRPWVQDFVFCLALVAALFIVCLLLYAIFVQPALS